MQRDTVNVFSRLAMGLCLAMMMTLLIGCQKKITTSDQDLQIIDYQELLVLQQNRKEATIVIDVRPAEKYDQGHIPGAVSIPLPQIQANDPRLVEVRNIVVYGQSWDNMLSPAAAKKLLVLGYRNVYDFRGGIELWTAEGRRLESSDSGAAEK